MILRSRNSVSVGAAICALALIALPLSATAGSPGSNNVDLRANPYGAAYEFGQAIISLSGTTSSMPSGWNDRVSSLWVWSPIETVTLYPDPGYGGKPLTFVYGTDDLRWYNFNDLTSSIVVVR